MIEWTGVIPAFLTALLIVAVCGLPIAFGLRVRGFAVAVVTIPAAFGSIALSQLLTQFLPVTWSLFIPFAFSSLLGATLWFITSLIRRHQPTTHDSYLGTAKWAFIATAFASAITIYTFMHSVSSPDSISQTYDAVFHLNLTKVMLETGEVSPLLVDLATPGNPSFYPSLWHATVSLIVQVSGASIPVAMNAMTLLVTGVVWSIGAVALGRAVVGSTTLASLVSGALAPVFPSLPLSLASFGVLYPNLLAMTLLPYVLVGTIQLLGVGPSRQSDPLSPLARTLLLLGSIGAAFFAHPNALHVAYLLLASWVIWAVVSSFRSDRSAVHRSLSAAGLLGFVLLGAALWHFGRTSINPWGGSQGPFGALIEGLGAAPRLEGQNWILTIAVFLGALVVFLYQRQQFWPLFLSFVTLLGFYILAEGFPQNPIRELFLSPWYSDPWRLAATLPLAMFPLAVIGVHFSLQLITPVVYPQISTVVKSRAHNQIVILSVAGFSALAVAGTTLYPVAMDIQKKYQAEDETARVLDPDEQALLERLGEHVPEDGVIIVNPWNGSSLAFALADRSVTMPHMTGTYDESVWIATKGIAEGQPDACTASANLGASFVLDFGEAYIFRAEVIPAELEAVSGIENSSVLTEIDREGTAVLYEITGCH